MRVAQTPKRATNRREGAPSPAAATGQESRLRSAQDLARLASWEWTPSSGEVFISHALPESGALTGTRASVDDLIEMLPAGERSNAREDLARLASGELDESVRRHAYSLPGRGDAWLETKAQAVRDDTGQVVAVRGTSLDVTESEQDRRRAHDALEFVQQTLDSIPFDVAVLDAGGEIVMTNSAWRRFTSAQGLAARGEGNYLKTCEEDKNTHFAQAATKGLRAVIDGRRQKFQMDYSCGRAEGEMWFRLTAVRHVGSGQKRIVVAHEDITERKAAASLLRLQSSLIDAVDLAVVAADGDERVTFWSTGAEALYGWTASQAMGRRLRDLIAPNPESGEDPIALAHGSEGHRELRRRDGSRFTALVRRSGFADPEEHAGWSIDVAIDISQRIAERHALLASRNHLRAVTDSMEEGMFTLDLDGKLTYMNDAAERMLGWSRHELLGRAMHEVAHGRRPDGSRLSIEESPILRAQIDGVAVRVEDDLFTRRDGQEFAVAYTASPLSAGRGVEGCVVVFADISERKAHEEMLRWEAEKLAVLDRVKSALAEDRLVLHAQPIVDLRSRRVVQRELLLRMEESGGVVVAGAFMPIIEQYDFITEVDRFVITKAVEIAAKSGAVQLNISACSIADLGVLEHVERSIAAAGIEPRLLVFEITESAIIADEPAAVTFAERLRQIGCRLALDDFGTGYGSFTYLKHLPVDYLKIDIEFVRDILTNSSSRHVVKAVVALAHSFGLQTVGEGVESLEVLKCLQRLGVDFAQGYLIGRPALPEAAGEYTPADSTEGPDRSPVAASQNRQDRQGRPHDITNTEE